MKCKNHVAAMLLAASFVGLGKNAVAQEQKPESADQDLTAFSLEDLTRMEVSSVSRKDQELYKTPAAVFVITREDIRNSGANSIPELFRMVPGMQVAQSYANEWALSARGFNSIFADKMLVLMDGRSIYSEIYSGVFWGQNDLLLEDIERIEVIRGPGGTLWGANAVNGIINIITAKAKVLKGAEVIAAASNMERLGGFRFGGDLGRKAQYRIYLKDQHRAALQNDDGSSAHDGSNNQNGGARLDWQISQQDWLTFHGSALDVREDKTVNAEDGTGATNDKLKASTVYGLARWEHRFKNSDLAFQSYFSQEIHRELFGQGRERTLDFDFEHHLPRMGRHDVNWGLGYRLDTDHLGGAMLPFLHNHHRDQLYSSFFEDEVSLVPNKLTATGGFKLQHNSYSKFEVQPTLRLLWNPRASQSFWAAASRAVRTPSVQDRDLNLTMSEGTMYGYPLEALVSGNPNFRSEVLRSYEAGYRQRYRKTVSLDLATFFNVYSGLRNRIAGTPYMVFSPGPTVIVPLRYDNGVNAHSRGMEASLSWAPSPDLHLNLAYAIEKAHLTLMDQAGANQGDNWATPAHTVNARANWNFARHWNWFTSYAYVGSMSPGNVGSTSVGVPEYHRLDTHVAYSISHTVQLRAGGDNLLEDRHMEFNPADGYSVSSRVPRSGFVKLTWSF